MFQLRNLQRPSYDYSVVLDVGQHDKYLGLWISWLNRLTVYQKIESSNLSSPAHRTLAQLVRART